MANIWHPFMQNITTIILFQDIATIILFFLRNILLFYAPKRLKTYAGRGVNSFKAPNPSLTRFSLPKEGGIVYPGDSPIRLSAAKRGFSATEISDEFESPKRRKVDRLQLIPPARLSRSSLQIVSPARLSSSSLQLVSPARLSSSSLQLVSPARLSRSSLQIVSPDRLSRTSLQIVSPARPSTPRPVAQCAFARVEVGDDDDHSPIRRQKSAVIHH